MYANSNPELSAWLGDTETTDEQRDRIERAAQAIDARYPIPVDGELQDVAQEREAALSAAVQVILGDTTLEDVAAAYLAAKAREVDAHAAQTGAIIAEARTQRKVDLARRTGLSRPTIDKALGAHG